MKKFIALLFLLPTLCLAQGSHRINQVIVKGNGITANVSPGSKILVCVLNTGCATAANIYLDPALTTPAFNPITADGSGNYDYYISSGCVDEQISSPGQGTLFLPHVCPFNGQSSGNIIPAPQYRLYIQPNAGTQAVVGPATTGVNAVAPLIQGTYNPDLYGTGNNGIATLLAGPCASGGCTIAVPATSTSTETFSTTPNKIHIQNFQTGQQTDWFHTSGTAQTENLTSDQDGISPATTRPIGWLRNFSFSGKGYSQGNQWTVQKAFQDNYNFFERGIGQNWSSICSSNAVGDKSCGTGYHYSFMDAGATAGSDEGITPSALALAQNNNWYHGLVSSGATKGSVLVPTTYNSSIGTQNRNQGSDGGYAIDITQGTVSGTVTGVSTAIYGGGGPNSLPVTSAVASTACGTIETNIPQPANPIIPESITINVDISKCGGAFTAGGTAELSGNQFIEQVPVTAVGTPSGSIQSVTITHRYPNSSGNSLLVQGGTHGYISYDHDIATNGFRTVFPVAGALDSTHLIIGFQLVGVNMGGTGPYIAPLTMATLTSTGTTVSGLPTAAVSYNLNRLAAAAVTGCTNSAFNGAALNIVVSDNPSNYSEPIFSWTQSVAAGTSTGCLLSYPSTYFGYHVYPGAEQIAPMTAANQLPLEPNDTAWTSGDAVEVAQNPAWKSQTTKSVTTLQNLHVYVSDGHDDIFSGDGISGDFVVRTDNITTPCAVYLGCGGTLASVLFEHKTGVSSGIIKADNFPINGNPAFTIGCLPSALGGCSNTSRQTLFALQGGNMWWYPSTAALATPVFNAFTGFQINGAAPSGHCLLGNGTNYVDSSTCSTPYPPAGVPVSTGSAWGTSIAGSTICLSSGLNCPYVSGTESIAAATYTSGSCGTGFGISAPSWWTATSSVTITYTAFPSTANGLASGLVAVAYNEGSGPQATVCNYTPSTITTTAPLTLVITGRP